MTLLSRVRLVLSTPLVIAQRVARFVGFLLETLSTIATWLNRGNRAHIWWPIVVAKRMIQGRPVWNFHDLAINGIQPTSKRALAIARADKRLVEVSCPCGGKRCGGVQFLPAPLGGIPFASIPIESIMTNDGLNRAARNLANKVRAELEATHPTAAAAVTNRDLDHLEQLAINGKDAPPELVLRAVASVRGNPIVVVPPAGVGWGVVESPNRPEDERL